MGVFIGGEECRVIYVAREGQQRLVSSVWVGDRQVFPILRVGVTRGYAYFTLRDWAVSIGETYQTVTEITVPVVVIGPSLNSLFYNCSALTAVPDLDTSQVTDMNAMFNGCSSLTAVPAMDTSQVTTMRYMFYGCSSLTAVPAMDTSQVTDMYSTFYNCSSLTTIPELDTSSVTSMYSTFYGCSSLTAVPAMDTSQVTDMRYMFYNCSSLTTIPEMDTSSVTNPDYMFVYCSALESVTLPGMGDGFKSPQALEMRLTKLDAAAADALMESLGTPTPGGTLRLPTTAAGADTSIATNKNWTVTIG